MSISSARIFFRSLLEAGDPYALMNKLITSLAEENDWREFKEAGFIHPAPEELDSADRKKQNDSIKKHWSENISAFANSGDGLLIWGIKTKGNKADSISLSRDAVGLKERLDELKTDAADPPVIGIETMAVCAPESQSGFVVCFLPSSPFSPHRATFGEGYFIRSGDSSRAMRTEVLRRMFYPQINHLLTPCVSLKVVDRDRAKGLFSIDSVVTIENRGNASAQEAVVRMNCDLRAQIYHSSNFWRARLSGNYIAAHRQFILWRKSL